MAKDRNKYSEDENGAAPSKRHHRTSRNSDSEPDPDSDSDDGESRKSEGSRKRSKDKKSKTRTSNSKRRRSRESGSHSSSSEYDEDSYDSDSQSEYSEDSEEEEERRRRRKERKRREEKKERRRREKEKDKKRKRKEEEKKRKRKKDKKKETDKGKKGAVTGLWGKYGIIRETDMWNKRPEFTAWLAEVKKVNLESLPNWEEKQLFKDFMEDHNTATFPSKKYYNLDAYYQRQLEKEMKKGFTKVVDSERTIFNDEEQRRQEVQLARERQKEEQVEALKREMQSGMAQAMKEQSRLREEMNYQYKLGNFEAAAAIQRRLDPDVAM